MCTVNFVDKCFLKDNYKPSSWASFGTPKQHIALEHIFDQFRRYFTAVISIRRYFLPAGIFFRQGFLALILAGVFFTGIFLALIFSAGISVSRIFAAGISSVSPDEYNDKYLVNASVKSTLLLLSQLFDILV